MTTPNSPVITHHNHNDEEAAAERECLALIARAEADLADVLAEDHELPLARIA